MRSRLVFPTIKVEGKPYYDGGIADPIPIRRSIEDGNEEESDRTDKARRV